MRQLVPNDELDQKLINQVHWIEENTDRLNKVLYNGSINGKNPRSTIYSYYKRLSIWMGCMSKNFLPTVQIIIRNFMLI